MQYLQPHPLSVKPVQDSYLSFAKSLVARSGHPMFLLSGDLFSVDSNNAFRALVSVDDPQDPEAVFGECWQEVSPLIDIKRFVGNPAYAPTYRWKLNGEVWDISFTAASTEPTAILGILTKNTTAPIEGGLSNFRNILRDAPVGICIVNAQTMRVELVNDLFLALVDRKRENMEGLDYWEVMKETKENYLPIFQQVIESGVGYSASEHRAVLIRNGREEEVYVNFAYEPVRDESGQVSDLMMLAIDLTEQVKTRKLVEQTEERARLAIESASLGTYEVNLKTQALRASRRFQEIWGCDENSSRADYESRLHPEDLPVRAAAFQEAYKTGNLYYEARIHVPGDGQRWVSVHGKMFFDEGNSPSYLLGISQDISTGKRFTEELEREVRERTAEMQRKNAELNEINQQLEQFNYAASHDMQEPLRKVHTFTSFLLHEHGNELSEEARTYLQKIGVSAQRMKLIIEDLLNYTQQSKDTKDLLPTDLSKILSGVEADLELLIAQKGAIIRNQHLPVILAVPGQMTQLFLNLISNALKFCAEDRRCEITIEGRTEHNQDLLQKQKLESNREYLHLTFTDNGIGFEQQYSRLIFDLFKRLHTKAKYEGTGIGLGLCKKIVQNHKGAIWAESKAGEGATFHVLLPFA